MKPVAKQVSRDEIALQEPVLAWLDPHMTWLHRVGAGLEQSNRNACAALSWTVVKSAGGASPLTYNVCTGGTD